MALAGDGDVVVADVDLHLFLLHTGKIRADYEVVAALVDFDVGRPDAGSGRQVRSEPGAAQRASEPASAEPEIVEHAIHLVRESIEDRERASKPAGLTATHTLLFPGSDLR